MKRTLLVIALSALSAAVLAQTEVKAPSAQAPIGRLFFTPAERAQLDIARVQKRPPSQAAAAAAPVEATPAPPQIVTYGGIVRRSDGRSMLWINNRLVEEKDALKGLNLKGKVGADGAVTLQVPETGGSISVKVGQSVELQTGRVAEVRKPTPEAKSPAEEPKPAAAEPLTTSAAAAKPAAPENAEKKPAAGAGAGLKLDLGGNAGTSK